jgi:hypothetical protein
MGKRSETDKAIRNLMNWADRPEWSAEQTAVFDSHLAPVCDRIRISQEELGEQLAEQGYGGMLFGMMFEDFISRRLADDKNIIDDYLKRRGWRESVPGRRYLQQLRDSVLSLYEVVDVAPGRHCDLRDLVRSGAMLRVHEHLGTRDMVRWDRIAARVLNMNGRTVFSGGILPYPREAAQKLLKLLADTRKQFDKQLARLADKDTVARLAASENLDDRFLRQACPAFTSIWIMDTLQRLQQPLPELVNRDGEALVFCEIRFPFLAEQLDEIARRLDAAADWERDSPEGYTWSWLPETHPATGNPSGGMRIESLHNGQHPLSGTLELTPGIVRLTTNSTERAQQGQAILESLLQGLIGPALCSLQTPEQMLEEGPTHRQATGRQEPVDDIDPEIKAEIIQHALDRHYRRVLDEPVPALGDKTPRQCVRSKQGREKVIEWLKLLENNEQRRAASQGEQPYDSRWMWDELKLGKHRGSPP